MNLPEGAVVTVERTGRVDGAIRAGQLTVVSEPAPDPVAPDTGDATETETTTDDTSDDSVDDGADAKSTTSSKRRRSS